MAVVRIGFGAFLLLIAIPYAPNVDVIFSTEGITLPLYTSVPSPFVARLLFSLFLLSVVGLTAGYRMRLSLVVLILLSFYFYQLSLHLFPSSYNRLFFFIMGALLLSGADETLSIKARKKKQVSIFAQRLIMLQVTATYLGVGWQKVILEAWQGGEVLTYSFMGRWGTSLAHWLLQLNLPASFYDWSVFIVMVLEVALPLGLWLKPIQKEFMIFGLLFHTAVSLFLGIWWFMALGVLYVLFLDPELVRSSIETSFKLRKSPRDGYSH